MKNFHFSRELNDLLLDHQKTCDFTLKNTTQHRVLANALYSWIDHEAVQMIENGSR
jgi:hypothetical protein